MEDNQEKMKKIILFSIIGIAVLAVILIVVMVILNSIAESRNNIIIDGVSSKLEDNIVTTLENGDIYFSIEKMAPLLNYRFKNGEYGKASDNKTKCYVENSNEVSIFDMDSNVIYKLELANVDNLYEKFVLDKAVKRIDNSLYVSMQGLKKSFNVEASYDSEKNVLTIMTLPYLYNQYNDYVIQLGYTSISEDFSNVKAILYGYLVVVENREYYGVLQANSGETIIGTKYDKIQFMEETGEFLAQFKNKYGVLTNSGEPKIDLVYDGLKIIDSNEGLYLTNNGDKYGVLKRDGSVLLYPEYDYIGVKDVAAFPNDNIRNPYIILDSVIPVMKGGKIGFYGVDGSEIKKPAESQFTTLGCVSTTNSSDAYKNVLIIPETEGVEGIVVGVTNSSNNTTYGIYSTRTKRLLTPTTLSKIYREVVNGQESYLTIFGGKIVEVKSRITSSLSNLNANNTVNVEELITTPSNTYADNTIGTNSISGNMIENNVNANNSITNNTISNSSINNLVPIDINSDEPVLIP